MITTCISGPAFNIPTPQNKNKLFHEEPIRIEEHEEHEEHGIV